MFATNHVAHTAYEHMCFQQRVALEESLAARHAEAALAAPAQSQTRPRTASKDDRLPTARSASGSPVSVRMSSRKVSKKSSNKGKGAPSSSRREAARRVAHKIKMYESEAQRRRSASPPDGRKTARPSSPSVFETGNESTHQDEFAERRRHPHLRTNWEYASDRIGGSQSPSSSPDDRGVSKNVFSPMFTAIRENALAQKEEARIAREEARARREQRLRSRSASPPVVYVANSTAKLGTRIQSVHRPNERATEIQGFAQDPTVSLARLQNAQRAMAKKKKTRSQPPARSRSSRSIGRPTTPTVLQRGGSTRMLNTGVVEHKVQGTWTSDVADATATAALQEVDNLEEEEVRIAAMMASIDQRLARAVDSRFLSRGRAASDSGSRSWPSSPSSVRARANAPLAGVDSRAGKANLEAHIFGGLRR